MDPVTAAILASTAVNIGTALWGQSEQNDAAARQRAFEAMKLRMNQKISQVMINDLWRQTSKDVRDYKKAVKTEIGSQRANYAAQGVNVSTGSANEMQLETAYQAEVDILTMRNNAYRQAFGYKVQALTDALNTQNMINASKNQERYDNITTGIGVTKAIIGALPSARPQGNTSANTASAVDSSRTNMSQYAGYA